MEMFVGSIHHHTLGRGKPDPPVDSLCTRTLLLISLERLDVFEPVVHIALHVTGPPVGELIQDPPA